MRPVPFLLLLAALPASAATPQCPPVGSGGVSTNWGQEYREHVLDIFTGAKLAAGVTQDVLLINVNDLQTKNAGTREVDGSPISALPKGTQGLRSDAIIYTFGVFEIACDEAQLATFMLHEMKHLKRDANGKNHFDKVQACRKEMVDKWVNDPATDLSKIGDDAKSAIAAFDKAKGVEFQKTCVLPVENEADRFAFDTLPKLPYKIADGSDPNRDARAQAFRNAETWAKAIGDNTEDPGHGSLGGRADAMAAQAAKAAAANQAKAQERMQMSFAPGFNPDN